MYKYCILFVYCKHHEYKMMPLTSSNTIQLLFMKMARISILVHMSSYGSLSNLIFFSMHNNRIIRENENGNEIAQSVRKK